MTQTIALNGSMPEINPLYIKLRRRFSYQGDRTIGEVKAQEAIRDGYAPFATPARRTMNQAKNAAECHVTRANSLPTRQAKRQVAVRSSSISGGTVVVLVLCAFLLLFLLFSGARISELKNELSGAQNNASELRVEDRSLNLAIADAELFAAEGACEDGDMNGGTETSNLLRAFSQN
ncbi:MAG: hypothetical protein IJ009_07225 [Clostridia bacterium]|nr:hypothetical protein [Clostridia bacterium]